MSTIELDPAQIEPELQEPAGTTELGRAVLITNARWFVRIRWLIVALLALLGLTQLAVPHVTWALMITLPAYWLLALAGLLAAANLGFQVQASRLREDSPGRAIEVTLWLQIGTDLAVITLLVRLIGSTSTLIAFAYLFHISLACILFPPRRSFLVTLLAMVLYLGCVLLESLFSLPVNSILTVPDCSCEQVPYGRVLFAGSATMIWLAMWYLVSRLAEAIRLRDHRLDEANRRILKADQEQNRQVLRTTHDLKVPFSGIETSIQRLRVEHWESLSEPVQTIIERIERRSESLRKRVADILLLGELRSKSAHHDDTMGPVDLREIMEEVTELVDRQLTDLGKGVSLEVEVPDIQVYGDRKQFGVLISNLVSNAISYSREGGRVLVSAVRERNGTRLSVSDSGIGIRRDALEDIFEDYFRTKEAIEYNKMSTGLGLSIVKEISRRFGLKLSVSSEEGVGTIFEVVFPAQTPSSKQRRKQAMAKIMVIDDDVEHADDLAAMLKTADHAVATHDRIEGAIERLIEEKPDVLVLDVMFPEDASGGMSLAISIRKQEELKTLPIIMLTGVNQEFPLDLSEKDIDPEWLPVQEFIEKPVDLQVLLKKVDELLA